MQVFAKRILNSSSHRYRGPGVVVVDPIRIGQGTFSIVRPEGEFVGLCPEQGSADWSEQRKLLGLQ
jgi:hypothetical protein